MADFKAPVPMPSAIVNTSSESQEDRQNKLKATMEADDRKRKAVVEDKQVEGQVEEEKSVVEEENVAESQQYDLDGIDFGDEGEDCVEDNVESNVDENSEVESDDVEDGQVAEQDTSEQQNIEQNVTEDNNIQEQNDIEEQQEISRGDEQEQLDDEESNVADEEQSDDEEVEHVNDSLEDNAQDKDVEEQQFVKKKPVKQVKSQSRYKAMDVVDMMIKRRENGEKEKDSGEPKSIRIPNFLVDKVIEYVFGRLTADCEKSQTVSMFIVWALSLDGDGEVLSYLSKKQLVALSQIQDLLGSKQKNDYIRRVDEMDKSISQKLSTIGRELDKLHILQSVDMRMYANEEKAYENAVSNHQPISFTKSSDVIEYMVRYEDEALDEAVDTLNRDRYTRRMQKKKK